MTEKRHDSAFRRHARPLPLAARSGRAGARSRGIRGLLVETGNCPGRAAGRLEIRCGAGGFIQSLSWTLYEAVTFDATRITSLDWGSYPILRFPNLPDRVDVHLIDRPGQPFLGTGEAAQGPAAAALANAVADATGTRIRELPLTRERVRASIGV